MNKYLQATTWQDRLEYVNNKSKVEPMMAKYYDNSVFNNNEYRVLTNKEPTNIKVGQVVKIIAALNKNKSTTYYVIKTSKGYKVDWESSVGYNNISVAEFKSDKSNKPTTFRGICRLYDSVEINQGITEKYWTIYINTTKDAIGTAYISKDSNDGKKLYNILKDGNEHQVIVDLVWKETNLTGDPRLYIKDNKIIVSKVRNIDSW